MSIATIEITSLLATGEKPPINKKALQGMLFMVSIFTYMLWTLTFKMNYTINSLFFLLGSTCMLLSFGTRDETVDKVGGWFGVATSVNAFVSTSSTKRRLEIPTISHTVRNSGWLMLSLSTMYGARAKKSSPWVTGRRTRLETLVVFMFPVVRMVHASRRSSRQPPSHLQKSARKPLKLPKTLLNVLH